MKALILFLTLITSLAQGQEIQMHGSLLNVESDTINIWVWSDGELIAFDQSTNKHYALILGEKPHYTILFLSGSKFKYCHLLSFNMSLESIQVDVDFRTGWSVVVYKKHARATDYTQLRYGVGSMREMKIPKIETE